MLPCHYFLFLSLLLYDPIGRSLNKQANLGHKLSVLCLIPAGKLLFLCGSLHCIFPFSNSYPLCLTSWKLLPLFLEVFYMEKYIDTDTHIYFFVYIHPVFFFFNSFSWKSHWVFSFLIGHVTLFYTFPTSTFPPFCFYQLSFSFGINTVMPITKDMNKKPSLNIYSCQSPVFCL